MYENIFFFRPKLPFFRVGTPFGTLRHFLYYKWKKKRKQEKRINNRTKKNEKNINLKEKKK